MTRTNTSMGELRSAKNVAAPHIRVKGEITPMDPMEQAVIDQIERAWM
jgi:hypothetical protein